MKTQDLFEDKHVPLMKDIEKLADKALKHADEYLDTFEKANAEDILDILKEIKKIAKKR